MLVSCELVSYVKLTFHTKIIDEVLSHASLTFRDLDAIAVSVGPGTTNQPTNQQTNNQQTNKPKDLSGH